MVGCLLRALSRGLSVSLVLTGLAAAALAQPNPAFVFCRWQQGIFRLGEQGVRQIHFSHGDYVRPRFVPRRDAILINSKRGGRMGIWLINLGKSEKRLCDGQDVAVSRDGKTIAFSRAGAIYVRAIDRGPEKRVSPISLKDCRLPAFMPDGRVLFVARAGGRDHLYLITAAGKATKLAEGEILSAPVASPDGRTVAFQNGSHIYLLDLKTHAVRRLTSGGGVQSWPIFSADGRRLAYVESPTPFDGPRHVYIVKLNDPTKAMLAARDVMAGPDWTGTGFEEGFEIDLPAAGFTLWQGADPTAAEKLEHIGPPAWKKIEPPAKNLTAPVVLRTSWGALALRPESGDVVLLIGAEKLAPALTIKPAGRDGSPASALSAISVQPPDPDRTAVAFTAACGGNTVEMSVSLDIAEPAITLAGDGRAVISFAFAGAVLPDRLAADLVLTPDAAAADLTHLPPAPMLLALARGGNAMAAVIFTSPEKQTTAVSRSGDVFTSLTVDLAGRPVVLGLVRHDQLWRPARVRRSGDRWEIRWRNPCAGQWRAALSGDGFALSFTAWEDSPRREKWRGFGELTSLSAIPERSFIYLLGRTANTPATLLTPMDLAWHALGISRARELLDIDGIRAYRHAREYVPYKHPRVCLRILGWLYNVQRPAAKKKAQDVYRDIQLTLQGLADRIAEYQKFAAALAKLPAATDGDKKFLAELAAAADKVRAEAAKHKPPARENMDRAFARYMKNPDVTGPLEETVIAAYDAYMAPLRAYRALARDVRVAAGQALIEGRISPQLCARVRSLAWQVLRHRYYLEDDWRGEQPLGGPEVPYDKVMSL